MSNARILVVDDENDIRELVRDILSEEGYAVETAGNAAEARAACAHSGRGRHWKWTILPGQCLPFYNELRKRALLDLDIVTNGPSPILLDANTPFSSLYIPIPAVYCLL